MLSASRLSMGDAAMVDGKVSGKVAGKVATQRRSVAFLRCSGVYRPGVDRPASVDCASRRGIAGAVVGPVRQGGGESLALRIWKPIGKNRDNAIGKNALRARGTTAVAVSARQIAEWSYSVTSRKLPLSY